MKNQTIILPTLMPKEKTYQVNVKKPVSYSGIAYAKTSDSRLELQKDSFDVDETQVDILLDGPLNHKI